MRRVLARLVVVAAMHGCGESHPQPECGDTRACPDGLVCDAVEDVCTVPSQARAFDCEIPDRTGDDAPTDGLQLTPALECVSGVRELKACLFADDPGDWFQFDVPPNCTAVQIEARLTFPVAYEPVALQLSTDGSAPVTVDGECTVSTGDNGGSTSRCFEMVVANGSHHAIGMVHSGEANCDGDCAFNRYTLSLQLSTP